MALALFGWLEHILIRFSLFKAKWLHILIDYLSSSQ